MNHSTQSFDDEAELPQETEELDFEPEEELGSVGAAQAKIKKLRAELKEAQQKRDEYLAGWQREKADAINMKKEAAHDGIRLAARVKANLIEDLLPSLDSFDMAYGSPSWESVDPTWRSGIDGIRNQLLEMLSKNGITRYGKPGDMLDPYLHEAVQEIEDVPGESGTIYKVLRYGYKAGEHVLRPAQVIVKA
ncbi:MAG: nucleotide exchange factor GrpE [Candidatus Pacebacteria bacterium]|nr:nucleotide exchange factor GrpE [Candidatus Paceibacterota bacterium]